MNPRKKIYFEPPKNTPLEEYITIEYGKIRDVHIVQLATKDERFLKLDPKLDKDIYLPLKNFHAPLSLKRIDKYISRQKKLRYTHEIILPSSDDLQNDIKLPELPPSEYLLKMMIGNRKMFIRLNFFEVMLIEYNSFSWGKTSTANKISIIGIAIAIAIAIVLGLISIFNK